MAGLSPERSLYSRPSPHPSNKTDIGNMVIRRLNCDAENEFIAVEAALYPRLLFAAEFFIFPPSSVLSTPPRGYSCLTRPCREASKRGNTRTDTCFFFVFTRCPYRLSYPGRVFSSLIEFHRLQRSSRVQ